jgi:hypothetical protein
MGLEHRWSERKPVALEALIYHRPQGLARATLLNLGLEGAFIRADHLILPVRGLIELTFGLDTGGKPHIYQLEALVIHAARGGYGLMFKDFRLDAFRAVRDVLSAA